MPVGRRRYTLSLSFLTLAVAFSIAGSALAEDPGDSHTIWTNKLSPDQIKAAMSKLAVGDDGNNDLIRQMVLQQMQQKHPDLPKKELDFLIKKALANPKLMEDVKQLVREKQTEPGRRPDFKPEDLNKLRQLLPKDLLQKKSGDERPKEMTTNPSDGSGSRPPIPMTAPNTDSPTPQSASRNPSAQGKSGPRPGVDDPANNSGPSEAPAVAKSPEDALFRPPDEPTDPRGKSLQAFASIWERNIGPLDQTPEVKKALFDLAASSNGLDFDFLDDKGHSIWDMLKNGEPGGVNFGEFMDGSNGTWRLPHFDFPSMKWGNWGNRSSPDVRSSSSSWSWGGTSRSRGNSLGGSGGLGSFGFGGAWFPVVVLGIVVLGIILWVVVKNLRMESPRVSYAEAGLGSWPIDPRHINTREDVVKAFEYLSVLICGTDARTWTHNTIADALADLAATHGETAVMLARLYELARYAPLDEPLTHAEVIEARHLVCGLAGVSL
jgi:hypothetical protein